LDIYLVRQRDVARLLEELRLHLEAPAVAEDARARRLGDPHVRSVGLDLHADDLVVLPVGADRDEVDVLQ
jgi:hypothetical protein